MPGPFGNGGLSGTGDNARYIVAWFILLLPPTRPRNNCRFLSVYMIGPNTVPIPMGSRREYFF